MSLTPPGSPSQAPNPSAPRETISAYTPSLWERTKNAITAGIPRYSSRTASNPKYGQMQLISPEEAMTPGEQQRHPVLTGLGEAAGGMTSPENTAILAASGGLGELPGAARLIVPRLISAGFSAQMLRDAYRQYPEFKAALDRGDESEAWRIGTHIVASAGLGLLSGRQAFKGKTLAPRCHRSSSAKRASSADVAISAGPRAAEAAQSDSHRNHRRRASECAYLPERTATHHARADTHARRRDPCASILARHSQGFASSARTGTRRSDRFPLG